MKTIMSFFAIVLVFAFTSSLSFAQDKKDDTSDNTLSAVKEVSINVPTVKCGSCVRTVTKALTSVDGVKEVVVDKREKTALVKYDASKVKISDLEAAIAQSGYDANATKRDKDAYENLDACCR